MDPPPPSTDSVKSQTDTAFHVSEQDKEKLPDSLTMPLKDWSKETSSETPGNTIPPKVPTQSSTNPSEVKSPATGSSSSPLKKAVNQINYNLLRFPLRVGITWRKGERLEAMDFSRTWYPSKIVEIDEKEKHVLIHFEGWNSRYDEWVAMDSDKLRPQTRHSERKDKGNKKRRNLPHPIYHVGEQVLARWTDCKKYPATVRKPVEDGSYEVVFYDGVTSNIQPINIHPMPLEMQLTMPAAPKPTTVAPVIAKPSFKEVPLKLPDHIVQLTKTSEGENKLPTNEIPEKSKVSVQPGKHSFSISSLDKSPLEKKRYKTLPGLVKRDNQGSTSPPAGTIAVPSTSPSVSTSTTTVIPSPGSTTSHATFLDAYIAACGIDNGSASITQARPGVTTQGQVVGVKRVKKRAHTDSSLSAKKKKQRFKRALESHQSSSYQGSGTVRAKSFDLGAPSSSILLPPLGPQMFIPSKAFVVEEDHNHFKCPYEGCTKGFRKENLLNYHIKYYHADPHTLSATTGSLTYCYSGSSSSMTPVATNSPSGMVSLSPLSGLPPVSAHSSVPGTPVAGIRKRRKKTDSICSTDSDLSISSRGKSSSKRHRHDSEISVTGSPDMIPREAWADVKLKGAHDSPVEDNLEPEDVDMEADLVNCLCGIRESIGLMIQCDVCMSWQHFSCVDTNGTGIPPNSYVCQACEKPKGIRDSCRYMYDMSFERHGELPKFTFPSTQKHQREEKTAHLRMLAKKCNALSSVLLGMKSALHSTRRQIKVSKEEDDREFQLWQTNWDNWTKPEEDLTLTPHSVDPVPSPTPSTFLFPPTPTPPATSNMSALSPVTSSSNQDGNLVSPILNVGNASAHDDECTDTVPFSPNPVSASTATSTCQDHVNATSTSPTSSASSSFRLSLTDPTVSKSSAESCDDLSSALSVQISPMDRDSSNARYGQSSSVTPPYCRAPSKAIPKTPLSERRLMASLNKDKVSSLVCDLFPGPGGDAPASDRKISVFGEESIQTKETPSDSVKPSTDPDGSKEYTVKDNTDGDGSELPDLNIKDDTFSQGSMSCTDSVSSASQPVGTNISTSSSPPTTAQASPPTISSLPFPSKSKSPPFLTTAASLPSTSSTTTTSTLSTVTTASTFNDGEKKQASGKSLSTISTENSSSTKKCDGKGDDSQIDSSLHSHTSASDTEKAKGEKKEQDLRVKKTMTSELGEETPPCSVPPSDKKDALPSSNHIGQLYIDVNERQSNADDCEEDNDTDTAEESADPYKNCEHNLLVHISNVHSDMESQLHELENHIADLEKSNLSDPTIQLSDDTVLNDIPALRKSLHKLLQNLTKVQQLSSH